MRGGEFSTKQLYNYLPFISLKVQLCRFQQVFTPSDVISLSAKNLFSSQKCQVSITTVELQQIFQCSFFLQSTTMSLAPPLTPKWSVSSCHFHPERGLRHKDNLCNGKRRADEGLVKSMVYILMRKVQVAIFQSIGRDREQRYAESNSRA